MVRGYTWCVDWVRKYIYRVVVGFGSEWESVFWGIFLGIVGEV